MISPKDIFRPQASAEAPDAPTPDSDEDDPQDLGFGMKVAEQSRVRLINRDGSFNAVRRGLPFFKSLNLYHSLLELSWTAFLTVTFAAFVVVNLAFGYGFLLLGPGALDGMQSTRWLGKLAEAFFFSVQTFTSVGYGHLAPMTVASNVLATLSAFSGLIAFALVAGLVFARFAQPQPQVAFSKRAVIAPYRDGTAFKFRIANQNRTHLLEVEAEVMLQWTRWEEGRRIPEFHRLSLERDSVVFFPLHWTIVHPIDEDSPLSGIDPKTLVEREAEFLIQLRAIDEASSEVVHIRSSYRFDEVVCGAAFTDILERTDEGRVSVDLTDLSELEPVEDSTGLPNDDESPSPVDT